MAFYLFTLTGCEFDGRHEELRKAVAAKKGGDVRKAISMYTKLIDEGAFTEDAHNRSILFYNRGIAFSDLKENQKAIDDFGHAIELRPQFVTCYHNRSIVFERMGNIDRAMSDVRKMLKLEPNDADAKKRLEYLQAKSEKSAL